MRLGPAIAREVNTNKNKHHEVLFDAGEVRYTQAAVHDMDLIDVHPGQILADHVCGEWDDMTPQQRATNMAAIQSGQAIVTRHCWVFKQGKLKYTFWFTCLTRDGSTTIYRSRGKEMD